MFNVIDRQRATQDAPVHPRHRPGQPRLTSAAREFASLLDPAASSPFEVAVVNTRARELDGTTG
jgi:hypothetical protein